MSQLKHQPVGGTLVWVLLVGLCLIWGAQAASGAAPPTGRTYFTAFFGLDQPYGVGTECFVFEESAVCSQDGQICGSWVREKKKGKEGEFSFELFFLEDGLPTTLEGQARIDSRGNKSSIAGAGRISQAGSRANFSFAGRAVEAGRCVDLVEESPSGTEVVEGSGNPASEERSVADFHGVVASGVGRVEIRHTGSESLTITADDNLLPIITSEVRDGRLILGFDPDVTFDTENEILFEITVSELDEISVSGVIGVDATGIDTDLFTANINGVSAVTAAGEVDRQEVTVAGVSAYNGRNLSSRVTTINVAGVSTATVRVSDELNGSVVGVSVLEYIGNPTVNVTASDTSTVRQIGG